MKKERRHPHPSRRLPFCDGIYWTRYPFRTCARSLGCSQQFSTAGRKSSLKAVGRLSSRTGDRTIKPNSNGSHIRRRRSKPTAVWVPHDTREQIVDFVRRWSDRTGIELVAIGVLLTLGVRVDRLPGDIENPRREFSLLLTSRW